MPENAGLNGPNAAGMLDDGMVPYRCHPTTSCMFARLHRPLVITTPLIKTHYYTQITRTMAGIPTPIPKLKLNDGKKLLPRLWYVIHRAHALSSLGTSVPMLGYGTGTAWYKNGDESKIDKDLIASITTAIKLEYYHLDGAEVYKTETELGTAIKESGVPREKLFVTTKVITNISDIRTAIDTSLKKLQVRTTS